MTDAAGGGGAGTVMGRHAVGLAGVAAPSRFASKRPPIPVPSVSRAFINDALRDLRDSKWRRAAIVRFLRTTSVRSWQQARKRPLALLELTAEHAALWAWRPGAWPVVSWLVAATHLGLLGEHQGHLGWPNRLTLLRANLPALAGGRAPWMACVALMTDALDGRLARRGAETAFGGYADELADAAFWTWFVWRHEGSAAARVLATGIWAGPVAAATGAYLLSGRAMEIPRATIVRDMSVAMQVAATVRALVKQDGSGPSSSAA